MVKPLTYEARATLNPQGRTAPAPHNPVVRGSSVFNQPAALDQRKPASAAHTAPRGSLGNLAKLPAELRNAVYDRLGNDGVRRLSETSVGFRQELAGPRAHVFEADREAKVRQSMVDAQLAQMAQMAQLAQPGQSVPAQVQLYRAIQDLF